MSEFKLQAPFQSTSDQLEAIKALVDGFKEGNKFQTLLGVMGSGKTLTMANIIQELQKPTLVIAHNETLAAQLYSEFEEFFLRTRWDYVTPCGQGRLFVWKNMLCTIWRGGWICKSMRLYCIS